MLQVNSLTTQISTPRITEGRRLPEQADECLLRTARNLFNLFVIASLYGEKGTSLSDLCSAWNFTVTGLRGQLHPVGRHVQMLHWNGSCSGLLIRRPEVFTPLIITHPSMYLWMVQKICILHRTLMVSVDSVIH